MLPTVSRPLYVHGSPSWVDLQTDNVESAKAFYGALFGWQFRKRFSLSPPVGPRPDEPSLHVNHMGSIGGLLTAEIGEREQPFGDMALPPSWAPYVTVIDIVATLDRVLTAGGKIIDQPALRGSLAVTATIADSADALLRLWQPLDMAGAGVVNQPGTLSWLELETDDLDRAVDFYGLVFGWQHERAALVNRYFDRYEEPRGEYAVFSTPMGKVAGAVEPTVPGIRASWCAAFCVDDVEASTVHAARLGGVILAEPYDIPGWRQSVVLDPTGAVFALLGPKTMTRRL